MCQRRRRLLTLDRRRHPAAALLPRSRRLGPLAGWSEWSLRFVSVFWGVLGWPPFYTLALALSRSRKAAADRAALLAACHPLMLYYSQEAQCTPC